VNIAKREIVMSEKIERFIFFEPEFWNLLSSGNETGLV
jgi:hypothetical protein